MLSESTGKWFNHTKKRYHHAPLADPGQELRASVESSQLRVVQRNCPVLIQEEAIRKRPDTAIHSWSLQILLVLQIRKFAYPGTSISTTGLIPLQETVLNTTVHFQLQGPKVQKPQRRQEEKLFFLSATSHVYTDIGKRSQIFIVDVWWHHL